MICHVFWMKAPIGGSDFLVLAPSNAISYQEGRRSHHLTIHTSIPDAPAADDIVVAPSASIGGRPHHRIGDRYQDLKDLGPG